MWMRTAKSRITIETEQRADRVRVLVAYRFCCPQMSQISADEEEENTRA